MYSTMKMASSITATVTMMATLDLERNVFGLSFLRMFMY